MQSVNGQPQRKLESELLGKIFATSPTAIVVTDRQGRIVEANPRAEAILQLHRGDLTKREFDDPKWSITGYDGENYPLDKLPFVRVRKTGKPVFNVRHAILLESGERLLLRINASPLFNEENEFDGMVAQIEDDTASVKAAQAYIESEAMLKSIFRAAPVGIGVVVNRLFTLVNKNLEEMLGYSEEELIGNSSRMLYPTTEDYEFVGDEEYRQIQRLGSGTVETHWRKKDGTVIDVLLSLTPIDLNDFSKGLTFSALDIIERKQMEERLRHSEKMEAVGQLAGGIAHDFNNQLAGIMGYADLLRMEVGGDPELTDYAEKILTGVRRSSDLTAQLLAFARKGKYLSVRVDLHAIIDEVISLLQHTINRNITIEKALGATVCLTKGDPSQLQNSILNLAINARDAMTNGGTLSLSTETVYCDAASMPDVVFPIDPGNYVVVTIRDTGEGIDNSVIEHIFEPFYTTKGEGKGTGLGLAAVYGTMKVHNGGVAVSSVRGEGTRIRLYLPVYVEDEPVAEKKPEGTTVKRLSGIHVMLIDDEEEIRNMVSSMLKAAGAKVAAFSDGYSAVEFLSVNEGPVDAVILDLVMPGLDAKSTFRKMRAIDNGLKVVIASGYSIDGEAQQLLDEGALRFIQKPFLMSELIDGIAEVVSG